LSFRHVARVGRARAVVAFAAGWSEVRWYHPRFAVGIEFPPELIYVPGRAESASGATAVSASRAA